MAASSPCCPRSQVYSATNVKLVTRTCTEHLSDQDKLRSKGKRKYTACRLVGPCPGWGVGFRCSHLPPRARAAWGQRPLSWAPLQPFLQMAQQHSSRPGVSQAAPGLAGCRMYVVGAACHPGTPQVSLQ